MSVELLMQETKEPKNKSCIAKLGKRKHRRCSSSVSAPPGRSSAQFRSFSSVRSPSLRERDMCSTPKTMPSSKHTMPTTR